MTEMPSKRRSGNRPSKDRTDTRDTRETIGLYIYIYIYIYICILIYSMIGQLDILQESMAENVISTLTLKSIWYLVS